MSIMNRILAFSRSPQGRRVVDKASRYAKSPEGKRRITEARGRVTTKRRVNR